MYGVLTTQGKDPTLKAWADWSTRIAKSATCRPSLRVRRVLSAMCGNFMGGGRRPLVSCAIRSPLALPQFWWTDSVCNRFHVKCFILKWQMAASPNPLPAFLPDPSCLRLDEVVCHCGTIVLVVSATGDGACPRCGVPSRHIHSRYCRTLRDLPCQGATLRICLRTRRFYCRVRDCPRRIFSQRLPPVALPYGRETCRYYEALLAIGYALGGEAGRRLAMQIGD